MKITDTSIDELALLLGKYLNKRTVVFCKTVKLDTLSKILECHSINGTFLGIPNCGNLTNYQLESICMLFPEGLNIVSNDYVQSIENFKSPELKSSFQKQYKNQTTIKQQNNLYKQIEIEGFLKPKLNINIKEKVNHMPAAKHSSNGSIGDKKSLKHNFNNDIIKQIRKELGLTQQQFAVAAGFNTVQQISGLENNTRGIGINLLFKVIESLKSNNIEASLSIKVKVKNKVIRIC
ncbi:MAG: Helix-turn-helix domain [Bacteroidota bacterium]|jgi:DNA-binding transcriptional regulator YiaG